jgi:hypothetical protein
VSEESRTNLNHVLHALKWRQARESEFERILMSNSILYCYQDASHVDPNRTKSIYLHMDNGPQINPTNSNITTLLCPISKTNTKTVSYPQPSVPSSNNDRTAIGFNPNHAPKNRYRHIDMHSHEADFYSRAISEARYNELHNTINEDNYFWK